jgi:hypothetical protein
MHIYVHERERIIWMHTLVLRSVLLDYKHTHTHKRRIKKTRKNYKNQERINAQKKENAKKKKKKLKRK